MRKITLIAFCIFGFGTAFCQSISPDVISSAGDFSTGSTVTVSWTLGEFFTETFSGSNNILTQGFQQSSYTITQIDDNDIKVKISVYPNPANSFINVDFYENTNNGLKIELVDIIGNTLASIKPDVGISTSQLDLLQYAPAIYFIKISALNGELLKSFQIVKH